MLYCQPITQASLPQHGHGPGKENGKGKETKENGIREHKDKAASPAAFSSLLPSVSRLRR